MEHPQVLLVAFLIGDELGRALGVAPSGEFTA
jgi:hypothetical protein